MKSSDKSTIVFFDIDYTLFDTARFKASNLYDFTLYPEVKKTLTTLASTVLLGIFSTGESGLQRKKLQQSGLLHLFPEESLLIFEEKIDNLSVFSIHRKKKIIVVDDKLIVLHTISQKLPQIQTIWITRGPYAAAQPSIPFYAPDAIISSLEELLPILSSGI